MSPESTDNERYRQAALEQGATPMPDGMMRLANALCGCCTRENTQDLLFAELERLERGDFVENDGLAAAFVDHLGLSEHGISIRGGWLTAAGKEALAFLKEHGLDWEEGGDFVDPEGCSHGA